MIRRMQEADLPEVGKLELLCFSDAWSETLLRASLESKLDIWYVLEESGRIAGYANLRIIADEGEIERIAIHPDFRSRGYGKKLMGEMVAFARRAGIKEMTLEVRASNSHALKLYESCGFAKEAVRKDYYRNPVEDGIIMWNRRI